MSPNRAIIGFALLTAALTSFGAIRASAATSSTIDILPESVTGPSPESVEIGRVRPIERPEREVARPPVGNPLWSIPLSTLTATQDRPIFSVSRRPPPRAVAGPRIEPPLPPPAVAAAPERPSLALIGAVVGDADSIAVFIDRNTQRIVRLRAGDVHEGWVLSSVLRREVTLKRADQTEVLVLQRPDGSPGGMPISGQVPIPSAAPAQGLPAPSGEGATPYAPFVPRSTPKNGESDGL